MTLNTKCPRCNYKATDHETVEGDTTIEDGYISFCLRCGGVNEFRKGKDNLIKVDLESLHYISFFPFSKSPPYIYS